MSNASNITDHRAYGAAVLERFAALAVPAELKPRVTAFAQQHARYEAACVVVDQAQEKRDAALAAVGDADDAFDPSVDVLANAVVGASLGKRTNPFAGYSKHSPSALKDLRYADEPKAMRELAGELKTKRPPAAVTSALSKCLAHATTLEAALKATTVPQAEYAKALGARDKLLPDWDKALRRLKKQAASTWDAEMETYRATFAPPADLQKTTTSAKPRKKKGEVAVPAPTPATTTTTSTTNPRAS